MAGFESRTLLTLGLVLLLVAPVSAVNFKVQISDVVGYDTVSLNHEVNGSVISVKTNVRNTGSIGCNYRLSGEFDKGGRVTESWSHALPLFPGGNSEIGFSHLVYNYTGPVNASVDLSYCGKTADIGNFTFNVTEKTIVENNLSSSTQSVNTSSAVVTTDVEEGTLIPQNVPSAWKVPSASVDDGKAVLQYDPTIFHPNRELSYFVVDSEGQVIGFTEVDLNHRSGIGEKLLANRFKLLLAASVLVNLLLLARLRPSGLKRLKALK